MEPKKNIGRKPKNNVIINENPKFEHEKVDNLISSLNVKNQTECSIDEIDGINGIDNYTNHQIVNDTCNKSVCWNCTHSIEEKYQLSD